MSLVDLLARTQDDTYINVEVQLFHDMDMGKGTLYYWSRVYSRQLRSGKPYSSLTKTITINILNYRYFRETDKFHTTFELLEREERFPLTDVMQIHFFEIPKLLVKWRHGKLDPRVDHLVRWMLFLGMVDDDEVFEDIVEELEEIAMKEDAILREAFERLEELSRDPNTWWEYESRHRVLMDELSRRAEREKAEAERDKAQADRDKAQADRDKAQADRDKAVEDWQKAEAEKQQAEAEKQKAEAELIQAEMARSKAQDELRLVRSETARKLQELGMKTEEIARTLGITAEELQKLL